MKKFDNIIKTIAEQDELPPLPGEEDSDVGTSPENIQPEEEVAPDVPTDDTLDNTSTDASEEALQLVTLAKDAFLAGLRSDSTGIDPEQLQLFSSTVDSTNVKDVIDRLNDIILQKKPVDISGAVNYSKNM